MREESISLREELLLIPTNSMEGISMTLASPLKLCGEEEFHSTFPLRSLSLVEDGELEETWELKMLKKADLSIVSEEVDSMTPKLSIDAVLPIFDSIMAVHINTIGNSIDTKK